MQQHAVGVNRWLERQNYYLPPYKLPIAGMSCIVSWHKSEDPQGVCHVGEREIGSWCMVLLLLRSFLTHFPFHPNHCPYHPDHLCHHLTCSSGASRSCWCMQWSLQSFAPTAPMCIAVVQLSYHWNGAYGSGL